MYNIFSNFYKKIDFIFFSVFSLKRLFILLTMHLLDKFYIPNILSTYKSGTIVPRTYANLEGRHSSEELISRVSTV